MNQLKKNICMYTAERQVKTQCDFNMQEYNGVIHRSMEDNWKGERTNDHSNQKQIHTLYK